MSTENKKSCRVGITTDRAKHDDIKPCVASALSPFNAGALATRNMPAIAQHPYLLRSMSGGSGIVAQNTSAWCSMLRLYGITAERSKALGPMSWLSDMAAERSKAWCSMSRLSGIVAESSKALRSMSRFSEITAQHSKALCYMSRLSEIAAQHSEALRSMSRFSEIATLKPYALPSMPRLSATALGDSAPLPFDQIARPETQSLPATTDCDKPSRALFLLIFS